MTPSRTLDRRLPAAVSIDLDGAASHLNGYRMRPQGVDELLAIAVPRLLELLARLRCRATLFVVLADLPERTLLDRALADGHEVAAHSVTHPIPFSRLPLADLRREVAHARDELQQLLGVEVSGFRAPNWDVDRRVMDEVARAGYRYDSSLLPGPFHTLIRGLLAVNARSIRPLLDMPPLPVSVRRHPYRARTPSGPIWEFPIPVTPWLRLPLYHTLRHRVPDGLVDRAIRAASQGGAPFNYAFHAIDAVALSDPGIDPRLVMHPGMRQTLDAKLAKLESALRLVTAEFRTMPYRDLVAELESRPEMGSR